MNAEVQNFCVSFDRYMKIEKGVVDVFCSTVNMDLWTQVLIDTWTLRKVW